MKGGQKQLVWKVNGTLPPLPEVLNDLDEVYIELQTTGSPVDFGEGFRLLYSFHEVKS